MKKKLNVSETCSTSGTKRELFNEGEWTAARFRGFVVAALRTATRRWEPKYKALIEAEVGRRVNKTTNKLAKHYRCNHCKEVFPAKEVQVDHINPVVCPVTGFENWDVFINRLFCEKENLQVLCKECHKIKTQQEKKERGHGKKTN